MNDISTISQLIAFAAERNPAGEFLRDGRTSITFSDAHALIRRQAQRLGALFDLEARIAIVMPNSVAWPITWLSVLEAGMTAVPTNVAYADADLRHVLRDSGAQGILTTARFAENLRLLVRDLGAPVAVVDIESLALAEVHQSPVPLVTAPTASTVANLQYTSGTTGLPKACILTHEYWVELGETMRRLFALTKGDVAITAQPFSYVDPQWNVVMCLWAGVPLVILDRFSASGFWREVRAHSATVFYVLGSMPLLLFKQPFDPNDSSNRVRLVLCSAIPPELHRDLEDRWGAPWREVYGLTESGPCTWVPLERPDLVGSGSIGFPLEGHDVRLSKDEPTDQVGELVVRTPSMMTGYHGDLRSADEVLCEGWFRTGDLATFDPAEGYRLVGRKKDMVRRGGENVACAEVEQILDLFPAVLMSAIVPEHDDILGEEVKAFIVPAPGGTPGKELAQKLDAHVRTKLALFKVPRYYEFVPSFPLTPSERIRKSELAARPKGAVYEFSKRVRRADG